MDYEECKERITNKRIKIFEGKSSLYLINYDSIEVIKVKVDSCLPISGKKCDYAIYSNKKFKFGILVELKGSNLNHALKQIENTINWFNKTRCIESIDYCFVIMSGKCPMSSGKIQIHVEKFKKQHSTILRIKRSGAEIDILKL